MLFYLNLIHCRHGGFIRDKGARLICLIYSGFVTKCMQFSIEIAMKSISDNIEIVFDVNMHKMQTKRLNIIPTSMMKGFYWKH